MKAVLLAGGLGTRMREETEYRPKPMVEIGNRPVLWHIMKVLGAQGIEDFVICTGYKSNFIKNYFLSYRSENSDFTIKLGDEKSVQFQEANTEENWTVTVSDTGASTQTGGRIKRIKKYVGDETFLCTYGDGIADVDVKKLIEFHKSHGKIATVTAVQPTSRFGVLDIDENGQIVHFREKPKVEDWISIGYFIFEKEVFDYIDSDESVLELETLHRLAAAGEVVAYKHQGFWEPMDTYRETILLNDIWDTGNAPWKMW